MTYEIPANASDRDERIAERMNEMLFNEFDIPLDDFEILSEEAGSFEITIEPGVGTVD